MSYRHKLTVPFIRLFAPAAIALVALVAVSAWSRAQQPPATPQQAPAAAQPAPAFPADARIAFVSIQGVIDASKLGQSFNQKVKALQDTKVKELEAMQKALQDNQNKLGGGMVDPETRARLQRDIQRQQVDLERAQQDAQAEVQGLQGDLQQQFEQQVRPIVEKVAAERKLHMLFGDGTDILWADRALDLTAEVARRLDAGK